MKKIFFLLILLLATIGAIYVFKSNLNSTNNGKVNIISNTSNTHNNISTGINKAINKTTGLNIKNSNKNTVTISTGVELKDKEIINLINELLEVTGTNLNK